MIIGIIVGVSAVLILIIFLKGNVLGAKETREAFLERFVAHVEGKRVPLEDFENSHRVEFDFEGNKFIYEDIEVKGFKGKVQKVYLKHQMNNNLSLNFSEKQISTTVRSDILIVSEISQESVENKEELNAPKAFEDFLIQTNNISLTNKLLEDKRVVAVLMGFKNIDDRGRPFISLRITDGMITLNFHAEAVYKPRLSELKSELASLEDYLDKMMAIAHKLGE